MGTFQVQDVRLETVDAEEPVSATRQLYEGQRHKRRVTGGEPRNLDFSSLA